MKHPTIVVGTLALYCFFSFSASAETHEKHEYTEIGSTTGEENSLQEDKETARDLFFRGIHLVETGAYDEALSAFQTSYRLHPKATVLVNIAMCHQALSHFAQALAYFNQYLATADAQLPVNEKKTAAVVQSVEKISDRVGHISIEDFSQGTSIEVDNVALPSDASNREITVDPGRHIITARKDGYMPRRLEVIVVSGTTAGIHLALQPVEISLTIDCRGVPAAVFIDDAPAGECPLSTRRPPGKYRLRVESEGRLPWHREVTLRARTPRRFDVALSPVAATAPTVPLTTGAPLSKRPAFSIPLIAGISMSVSGVACAVVGIVFTVNGVRAHDRAGELAEADDGSWTPDVRDEYSSMLTKATVGTVVGYTTAGLLLSTAAALFLVEKKKRSASHDRLSILIQGFGITAQF